MTLARGAMAVCAMIALSVAIEVAAQVKSHEAPGNLESTHDVGCVGSDRLQPSYTPADLYRATSQCVRRAEYRDAVFLFAMAGVYGRYDTLRVADKSAHQAVTVLQMQALGPLPQERREAFGTVVQQTLGSPDGLASVCKELRRIGPPRYHPRYMIQHGMGAFLTDGTTPDGLVTPFDGVAAWKRALDTFLHCPSL